MSDAPDLLVAFYAAVCAVRDGEVDEASVAHIVEADGRTETLSIAIQRTVTAVVEP